MVIGTKAVLYIMAIGSMARRIIEGIPRVRARELVVVNFVSAILANSAKLARAHTRLLTMSGIRMHLVRVNLP
mgnify:CR=1 FL=1